MNKHLGYLRLVLLPVMICGIAGCGGDDDGKSAKEERETQAQDKEKEQAIKRTAELVLWYEKFETSKKKPPSGWQDIVSFTNDPNVVLNLQQSPLQVTWNASLKSHKEAGDDLSRLVLVYDPDAAKQGGWVGMADGSFRKVTADEFQKLTLLGNATPGSVQR